MKRTFVGGLLLAVLASLAVWVGNRFGLGLNDVMFASGCGAVLGLIATKSPVARIGGFLIGFFLTWVLYGVSALLFPDASSGVVLQVLVTFVVITVVAGLLHSRMPFWTFLLGLVAMSGVYQFLYVADKPGFVADSVAEAGGALFAAGLGLLAVAVADLLPLGVGEGDDLAVVEPQFAGSSSTSAKG